MKKNNILTYILLVLTAVFWGGSFVLTKEIFLSAPSITPSIIVTLRLVIASVVFVPFLLITKKWQRIERKDWKYFFILAFLEPFTYFLCENNGIKLVPGGISSIIIATIPVFVPFGLYFAYHEKLHKINIKNSADFCKKNFNLYLQSADFYVIIFKYAAQMRRKTCVDAGGGPP